MVGVSKTLDFPGLRGVSGPTSLADISAEVGREALAADLTGE